MMSRVLRSRSPRISGKVEKQVTPEGVAGVDARRATPPDPRLPRRGLAGCRPLDPSHPVLVTCEEAKAEACPGSTSSLPGAADLRHRRRSAHIRPDSSAGWCRTQADSIDVRPRILATCGGTMSGSTRASWHSRPSQECHLTDRASFGGPLTARDREFMGSAIECHSFSDITMQMDYQAKPELRVEHIPL
jgi:hypothetical protein